jgi:HNH endonuclease
MCRVEGCLIDITSKGLCPKHYQERRRRAMGVAERPKWHAVGSTWKQCSIEGCGRKNKGRGLCAKHLQAVWRREKGISVRKERQKCSVDGCIAVSHAKGLCPEHYVIARRNGDPTVYKKRKNGEGHINPFGYKQISVKGKGQILEHRHFMEEKIGRTLLPNESVHHKNGDKLDNRIENLELWSTSQPYGQRTSDKVAWALELLSLYAPARLA